MTSKSKVYFFFEDVTYDLSNRIELKRFIESIFKREKQSLISLNFVFCSDKRLLNMNKYYLGHDYYTDIITFDLSQNHKELLGEIYISLDRVRANAKKFKTTTKAEIHRVIFHGVLHLCGYQDKTEKEKKEMKGKEDYYLTKYFSIRST